MCPSHHASTERTDLAIEKPTSGSGPYFRARLSSLRAQVCRSIANAGELLAFCAQTQSMSCLVQLLFSMLLACASTPRTVQKLNLLEALLTKRSELCEVWTRAGWNDAFGAFAFYVSGLLCLSPSNCVPQKPHIPYPKAPM